MTPKFKVGDLIRHKKGRLRFIKEITDENYNCPLFKYKNKNAESIYLIYYIDDEYILVIEEERAKLL